MNCSWSARVTFVLQDIWKGAVGGVPVHERTLIAQECVVGVTWRYRRFAKFHLSFHLGWNIPRSYLQMPQMNSNDSIPDAMISRAQAPICCKEKKKIAPLKMLTGMARIDQSLIRNRLSHLADGEYETWPDCIDVSLRETVVNLQVMYSDVYT